ncbi:hypothetical protein WN944_004341 [Citrus x changshan-huyou]|uniref:peroxidase n=1 Tax=Citrus x changshan-huyou TaxID=2935761 RepID=A0AAP0M6D5_9ROSI
MSLGELISAFADKGLTAEEMAALSGARTIGQAPTDIDPFPISFDNDYYKNLLSLRGLLISDFRGGSTASQPSANAYSPAAEFFLRDLAFSLLQRSKWVSAHSRRLGGEIQ